MSIEEIISILKPLNIPVVFGDFNVQIKESKIYFYELKKEPSFFDDDEYQYFTNIYRFNVLGLDDNVLIYVNKLVEILQENGFKFLESKDLASKQTGVIHVATDFEYEELV
ncbi:MAG: hypothetical protein ACRCWG_13570 [Sarcina sp.]